jgi:hypothetical protein
MRVISCAGFIITQEALTNAVSKYINSSAVMGWTNMGTAITALKNTAELRWVNPLELKNAVESALTNRFGAKETAKPKGKVRLLLVSRRALCILLSGVLHVRAGTEAGKGC